MDPDSRDESLQKTSPTQDPAAFSQLFATMSAQASQLAAHQHQLNRLTTLTEDLVKALQALHSTPTSTATTTPSASAISHAAEAPSSVSPRLSFPERFDGDPARFKGFCLQCSLFLKQQPALYPTEASKIAFVCSLLTGRALDWITAVWREEGDTFPSYEIFMRRFRDVFDHSHDGKEAGERLLELTQGRGTAAEYALAFRTLAAQTTWVDDTLKTLFRKGLSHELQTELACRDEGKSFEQFVELAIQIDNLIRARRFAHRSVSHPPPVVTANETEPMQVNRHRLSPEERNRRLTLRLCLYCGLPGHMRSSCPTRLSAEKQRMKQ